jgi:basic membrane protein A
MKAITSIRHATRLLWLLGAAALAFGCSESSEKEEPKVEKLKVAFVYLTTPGDVGWTYSHDLGRREAEAALEDVEITYKETVVDDASSEAVIEELVSAGNQLIFTTSWGYRDPTYNVASKYPDVLFEHCSGDKTLPNLATYFGRMYQARYLSGIVAGRMTANNKIGYVAAFPIPEVIRGNNASPSAFAASTRPPPCT